MIGGFRKKRRPGNRKPTKAEAARIVGAKCGICIPCLVWASEGHMPMEDIAVLVDYDHSKSGNIRRGHDKGYASCAWHHRQIVSDGWTHARMRDHFGPSLMDGSKRFAAAYGSDDDLIQLQTEQLEAA